MQNCTDKTKGGKKKAEDEAASLAQTHTHVHGHTREVLKRGTTLPASCPVQRRYPTGRRTVTEGITGNIAALLELNRIRPVYVDIYLITFN